MSITNYTELQTAVDNWLSRDGLTSLIPDFITLAEAKFNRALRTRDMEASATITPSSRLAALPSDFLELRRIYINSSVPVELEYVTPEQFWIEYPVAASNPIGPSKYFTIEGESIYLSDNTGTDVKALYYQKIPALSANATNWLLDSHPDIYLYAALAEAADKTKNMADFQKYNAKTQAVVDQLTSSDKHGKYSGSALRVIAA
jgi:hypothetical protein